MDLNLRGKVVVVSGASKGIGLAVTTAFLEAGASVLASSRESDAVLSFLVNHFPTLVAVAVDVSTTDGPASLVQQAVTRFGRLDILVNNVGGAQFHVGGFLSTTDEDWGRALEVNLMSTVRASRAALPYMIEQGTEVIVNVSSLYARQPEASVSDYSASKAAVTTLTKALAEEFGPKGIQVNAVSPGPVRTPLLTEPGGIAETLAQASRIDRETMVEQFPQRNNATLGRLIEPEEIASLVLFLASERATMIVGSDFLLDGGMKKTI